jgi:GNAT superfamily N-acetyltransferase
MVGVTAGRSQVPGAGGVACAGEADLDALSQVIAEAFHPLAPSRWLLPNPVIRRSVFPGYFRLYLEHALAFGVIHTTADRSAAALWIRVGPEPPAQLASYDIRLAALAGPWTERFRAFDAALEQHQPAGVVHHHLTLLAVRPDRQGQGIGTGLLRHYHQALDRDGREPAFLEASDLRTRRIYQRHGYTDHGGPIELPGGPFMYPMTRAPRGTAGPVVP